MQQSAGKQSSWADVVRGEQQAQPEDDLPREPPLVPGRHGSRRALCRGELLVMLGHYGWIKSSQAVVHPDSERHGGRIYVKACDLRRGAVLTQGCEVSFYLYADENGLGAGDCHLADERLQESGLIFQKTHRSTAGHHAKPGRCVPLRTDVRKWQHNVRASMPMFSQNERTLVTLAPIDAVSQRIDTALRGARVESFLWTSRQTTCSAPCSAFEPRTRRIGVVQTQPDLSETASEDSDEDESDQRSLTHTQPTSDSEEESVPLGTWTSLAARCSQAIGDAARAGTPYGGGHPAGKFFPDSRGTDASTVDGESSGSESGFAPTPPMGPIRPPLGLENLAEAGAATTARVAPPPGLELSPPPGIA